jgi:leucyl aminopeptidase
MGNNENWTKEILKAAETSGEGMCELPITDEFRKKTKGDISDLKNWTAGVSAGSSMGGAFLEEFVEKTPWVHLDIAGTAFHGKYGDAFTPKGATGVMMRTLREVIEGL